MTNNQSTQKLSEYITIGLQDPLLFYFGAGVHRTSPEAVDVQIVHRTEKAYQIDGFPSETKAWFNKPVIFDRAHTPIRDLEVRLLSDGYDYEIKAKYASAYVLTPKDLERNEIPEINHTKIKFRRYSWRNKWTQMTAETTIPKKRLPNSEQEGQMALANDLTTIIRALTQSIETVRKISNKSYKPIGEIFLAHPIPGNNTGMIFQPDSPAKSYDIFYINDIPVYVHQFNKEIGKFKPSLHLERANPK